VSVYISKIYDFVVRWVFYSLNIVNYAVLLLLAGMSILLHWWVF